MTDAERLEFAGAMPVTARIGDEAVTLLPKKFGTGSLGWHAQGKMVVHGWRVQVNLLLTVVGSKPVPDGEQKVTPSETTLDGPQTLFDEKEQPEPRQPGQRAPRPKKRG